MTETLGIAASAVDPFSLSSLPLRQTRLLPETPAIYFAIDAFNTIHYIGCTGNLRRRWSNHNHRKALSLAADVRVAYLEVENEDHRIALEKKLILMLKPLLNVVAWQYCIPGMNCPHCQSERVTGNGKTTSGNPRYRCLECKKTWSGNPTGRPCKGDRPMTGYERLKKYRQSKKAQ